MRLAALWALLAAVYAVTLTIPATATDQYAGDEPHYLLAAKSWSEDGDMDLRNQYAQRQWREFTSKPLRTTGTTVLGRLREPEGTGLPLLVSPAYGLGGAGAVEALIAAITALGFVLAAALARRLVPEPWASTGAVLVGLSPPVLAAATTVGPEPVAGTLLAGAALCALKVRDRARLRYAYGSAAMLAFLPWMDAAFVLPAIPVGYCLVRWTLDERRRLVALVCAELLLGSLVFYARVNETLYGGPVPGAARAGGSAGIQDMPGRLVHLLGVWLDPVAGLLRWAPILALTFYAAWLLWRSRREHVAAAIAERREAERAAGLLLATAAGAWVVAALGTSSVDGPWFPGLPMLTALPVCAALVSWGLRPARLAGAVLGALTLALSVWVLVAAWSDGWLGVA